MLRVSRFLTVWGGQQRTSRGNTTKQTRQPATRPQPQPQPQSVTASARARVCFHLDNVQTKCFFFVYPVAAVAVFGNLSLSHSLSLWALSVQICGVIRVFFSRAHAPRFVFFVAVVDVFFFLCVRALACAFVCVLLSLTLGVARDGGVDAVAEVC